MALTEGHKSAGWSTDEYFAYLRSIGELRTGRWAEVPRDVIEYVLFKANGIVKDVSTD